MYKKNIFWTNSISRPPILKDNRQNYLRLDKNEWVGDFNKKIIKNSLKKLSFQKIVAYPNQFKLYKVLSKVTGFKSQQLILTPGSDAGIKNCFELCFREKGGELITTEPTYEMVNVYARLYETKNKKIGFDTNLSLNIKKLIDSISSKTSLIIIANPNSPTGTQISEKNLIKILLKAKKNKALVLIDEAYYGFSKYTSANLIKRFNNLIISRSLSKYCGIAGIRVGYLISNKFLAKLLYNLKPTYEINSVGIELAIAMLNKNKLIEKYFKEVKKCKNKIIKICKEKKLNYLDSNTNFIYINFGKKEKKFLSGVKKEKILIGKNLTVSRFKKFKRFTIGPFKSMARFFKILRRI